MKGIRMAALALLLPLALAACGGSPAGPARVEITEREWGLEPAAVSVKDGSVTFEVTNAGALEHNFEIEGAGKIELLLPQESKTLEVKLAAGTYTIMCSLPGHKEAGMVGTLTVTP